MVMSMVSMVMSMVSINGEGISDGAVDDVNEMGHVDGDGIVS